VNREREDASADVLAQLAVSRETLERLTVFAALLRQWSPRINLVSRASLPQLWTRHIVDSAQLLAHAPGSARHWLDIGSGGGFPGMVCAIVATESHPCLRFTLVESDRRKSTFLRTVARETGVHPEVKAERVEALSPQAADIVSARAVAPLVTLFDHAYPHVRPGGMLLFLKGARYAEEIDEARASWRFTVDARASITAPDARILICRNLSRL
jgi:16S rRNA (guanine527-N7)-methyltransferase